MSDIIPFPLTDPKYRNFLADKTDPIVLSVKDNLNILSTNLNLFVTESALPGRDTIKLGTYIKNIENKANSILVLLTDCANNEDKKKCSLPVCKNNIDIQNILIDLIVKFSLITRPPNEKFNYLPFLLTNSLAKLITDNKKNMHNDGTYYLCNTFQVTPPNPNSPTFSSYQDLIIDANTLQSNNDQAILTNQIITYLGYSAIVLVLIIIAIYIYYKVIKNNNNTVKKIGGYFSKNKWLNL